MNFKIVADSSANVLSLGNPNYKTVPMKVVADQEYVDVEGFFLLHFYKSIFNISD